MKIRSNFLFNSGDEAIDQFFDNAENFENLGYTRIYVAFDVSNGSLVGYYTLSADSLRKKINEVEQERRWPVILLGQLGVMKQYQSKGIGMKLLEHAKNRANELSFMLGVRMVVLHTYNNENFDFFRKGNFIFEKVNLIKGKERHLFFYDIKK